MIIDVIKPEMTNAELHTILLATIRQEFSHNLSQQIYISDEVWLQIKTAQQTLLQLVNTCASKCDSSKPASDLAEIIIQVYSHTDLTPTELALQKLKNEFRNSF